MAESLKRLVLDPIEEPLALEDKAGDATEDEVSPSHSLTNSHSRALSLSPSHSPAEPKERVLDENDLIPINHKFQNLQNQG